MLNNVLIDRSPARSPPVNAEPRHPTRREEQCISGHGETLCSESGTCHWHHKCSHHPAKRPRFSSLRSGVRRKARLQGEWRGGRSGRAHDVPGTAVEAAGCMLPSAKIWFAISGCCDQLSASARLAMVSSVHCPLRSDWNENETDGQGERCFWSDTLSHAPGRCGHGVYRTDRTDGTSDLSRNPGDWNSEV